MKLARYGEPGQEKLGILDADGKIRDLSGMPIPSEPVIFMKATSAICGPNDMVLILRDSVKTDWEVELGVVISKGGKYIEEADALSHVAGYCVVNDVSEREFHIERGGTWDKGKGADTFGPIGPWLVTSDEVADTQNLGMWLDVDGKRYQDGSTKTMIFSVAHVVSYLSRFMSLQPSDVISTGTPPSVGMGQKPSIYLRPGQTMRLGIEGLGEQEQVTAQDGRRTRLEVSFRQVVHSDQSVETEVTQRPNEYP